MKMKVDTSIYAVRPFKEYGYRRQRCNVCGVHFWSVIERDDCGDAPCSDYTFFNIKLGIGPLSVTEVQKKFLSFFEKRGHKVIEPHPVLARWREDLYLTIASIIVFQPHVTSGKVPPPANPLVIAQPCIRLEDIESVGYTFGRHLTNFIMGGHHAFNYPNKFVYFTDETVEYAREFFMKELGVPEEEMTFKESWWEGGGNAGPSFEVAIGGLEVATLVFMMYDVRNGNYIEMPLKIVDTGYGIERIAWLTQKTPTAFHAIYGPLVTEYFKVLELEEPPNEFFYTAVKYIGRLNPRDVESYVKLRNLISRELDIESSIVVKYMDNSIKVFTLLDHLKTALLMLSDGAVPSNTGEGYLARLVLRRIFRILIMLGKEDVIDELIRSQIMYWSELYPNIKRMENYIYDVVEHELSKYKQVIERAPQVVRKYMRRGGLGLDSLIELYDSHGIPPELVKDIASREGVKVEIPKDFYSLLASRHSRAPIKSREVLKVPNNVINEVAKLPETRLIFHEDPYVREFEAKVIKVIRDYIVLDRTAFYPEGGGQEADRGFIITPNGRRIEVIDVQKVGNVVVHKVRGEVDGSLEGNNVRGIIDWERRYKLMRHHTATHIILGVSRLVLGNHVWQAGAEKTPTHARLDITHYRSLSPEEVVRIEELANKVIIEGKNVRSIYMPKYEAENKYGFRLYQGGVPLEPIIRVVEIEGLDAQACFGTHLRNTREVGGIKIINVEKIADGVVRLEFVAGTQLVNYARELEGTIREASKLLGGDIVKRAKVLTNELRQLKGLINKYRNEFLKLLVEASTSRIEEIDDVKLLVDKIELPDKELARNLLITLTKKYDKMVAIVLMPRDERTALIEVSLGNVVAGKYDAVHMLREIFKYVNGRGGGKKNHASGVIFEQLSSELVKKVKSRVVEIVRGGS